MSDKPILFSALMIRALLDGRKTQTRRGAKFVKPHGDKWHVCNAHGGMIYCTDDDVRECGHFYAPIWADDRLWVREAWKPHSLFDAIKPRDMPPKTRVFYLADSGYSPSGVRGRPGIHMPRFYSRLTLIVTDVRVQRLQEISEEDAIAEGCHMIEDGPGAGFWIVDGAPMEICAEGVVECYARLWDSINGPGSWERNDWVVAYTFTVHKANIDALAKEIRDDR